MLAAVITTVVLLLAGCGVVDRGLSAPAQPTEPATTSVTPSTVPTEPAADAPSEAATERTTDDVVGDTDGSDGGGQDDSAGAAQDDDADDRSAADGDGSDQQVASDRDQADQEQPSGSRDGSSEDDSGDRGDAVTRTLRRGDTGSQVRRLQRRLRNLRYWVGSVDGVYGQLTEQAVFAFQGVEGLAIDGIVGPNTRAALADATPPTPRSDSGNLIEVDEQARVVLDVRGGEVRWAWHTSTGTNERYQHPAGHTALAETPDGRHTIGWQVDGWRRNELGRLWRPKYFHPDGIALHGFSSVPATPSSHGCVRLTVPAMNFIWANDIAPEGSTVWVYGRAP